MRVAKLASQADLCYNEATNIVVAGDAYDIPARIHSWRNVPMTTLPPHAANGNIPTTSGIYKITCTANKRIYIGSAVNLRKRKNEHWNAFKRNQHHNRHLQRAWDKYGEQAFTFEVLELVLPMSLTAREQYWLNKLKPFGRKGFNIAHEAGSTLGYKYAPETVEKIRQQNIGRKQSPESIEKRRQYKRSPETLEKYRQNMLGNKIALGHSHEQSPETKEKIRQAKRNTKNSPEHCEKVRQARLGTKLPPETIEKMKQTRNTPEYHEKTRQTHLARWERLKKEQST